MTKPTRQQELACDRFADALLLIAEGATLDGKGTFGRADLEEVGARIAKASGAFGIDEIVARALETRGRALGLRAGTAELLTLMESDVKPLEMLLRTDDEFRALVAIMEAALGEV